MIGCHPADWRWDKTGNDGDMHVPGEALRAWHVLFLFRLLLIAIPCAVVGGAI